MRKRNRGLPSEWIRKRYNRTLIPVDRGASFPLLDFHQVLNLGIPIDLANRFLDDLFLIIRTNGPANDELVLLTFEEERLAIQVRMIS